MSNIPYIDEHAVAPASKRGLRLILWLVVMSLSVLFIPLTLVSATVRTSNVSLETELSNIKKTLTSPAQPGQEEQALKATLGILQNQIKVFATARANISATYIDWPAAMQAIGDYDMTQIIPTGLTQAENRVLLAGRTPSEPLVMAYAQRLRDSNQFKRVVVQSIITRVGAISQPNGAKPALTDAQYVEFAILVELKVEAP